MLSNVQAFVGLVAETVLVVTSGQADRYIKENKKLISLQKGSRYEWMKRAHTHNTHGSALGWALHNRA